MQDFPAKKNSSANSQASEEFGELEEILEWEDEIDLAKEIAEIDKDDSLGQEFSPKQSEGASKNSIPSHAKNEYSPKEKFDISEDISQDFFAVKPLKKKSGLLQAATKLKSIPGFDSAKHEEATLNFSTAVPNFCKEEIFLGKKSAANKKSLLAKAMSIASVSAEVICKGKDGIFSINKNLEMRGVSQDESLRQLVDSVLKN